MEVAQQAEATSRVSRKSSSAGARARPGLPGRSAGERARVARRAGRTGPASVRQSESDVDLVRVGRRRPRGTPSPARPAPGAAARRSGRGASALHGHLLAGATAATLNSGCLETGSQPGSSARWRPVSGRVGPSSRSGRARRRRPGRMPLTRARRLDRSARRLDTRRGRPRRCPSAAGVVAGQLRPRPPGAAACELRRPAGLRPGVEVVDGAPGGQQQRVLVGRHLGRRARSRRRAGTRGRRGSLARYSASRERRARSRRSCP